MELQPAQLFTDPCFTLGSGEPSLLRSTCLLQFRFELREFGFQPGDSFAQPPRLLRSALSCFHVFPQNPSAAQAA